MLIHSCQHWLDSIRHYSIKGSPMSDINKHLLLAHFSLFQCKYSYLLSQTLLNLAKRKTPINSWDLKAKKTCLFMSTRIWSIFPNKQIRCVYVNYRSVFNSVIYIYTSNWLISESIVKLIPWKIQCRRYSEKVSVRSEKYL